MRILCIGQVAYDITFPIKERIVENQKYRIFDKMECMGGPAGNAAYLCALWGADTLLQARVGDDIYGRNILEILKSVQVDTSCMHIDKQFETSMSGIIANQATGHRTIFNCPGVVEPIDFPKPKQPIDVILVDGHEPDASFTAIKEYPHAVSIIDAGTLREATRELAKVVDYLVCSQDFAYQYTGITVHKQDSKQWDTVFTKLRELNPHHIVVTMGEEGLLYQDEAGIHHIDAFPVKAIDTCGAGDIFHGAFAYGIANHYSLRDTCIISSLTSAISVESLGSQIAIPKKAVVQERLKEALVNITLL